MQTENCNIIFLKNNKNIHKTAIHAYYSDKIIHNIPKQKKYYIILLYFYKSKYIGIYLDGIQYYCYG